MGSTCNSPESKLTDILSFLPLSASPDTWATACLSSRRPADLQAPVKSLIAAGYDITTVGPMRHKCR